MKSAIRSNSFGLIFAFSLFVRWPFGRRDSSTAKKWFCVAKTKTEMAIQTTRIYGVECMKMNAKL